MKFTCLPICLVLAAQLPACGSSQDVFPSSHQEPAPSRANCNSNSDPRCSDKNAAPSPAPCPPGTELQGNECVQAPAEMAAEPIPPYTPVDPIRDPRTRRAGKRSAQLVSTELQALLALYEATPGTSPDRLLLAARTADVAAELAHISEKHRAFAQKKALFFYEIVAAEGTSEMCARNKSTCADEALYFMGLEIEMAGSMENARKAYFRLIKDHPSSKYVSYAYFAFGEFYYQRAKNEGQDFEQAEKVFEKVVSLGESPMAPESLLRLAELAQMREKPQFAVDYIQKLLKQYPESRAAQYAKSQYNIQAPPSN